MGKKYTKEEFLLDADSNYNDARKHLIESIRDYYFDEGEDSVKKVIELRKELDIEKKANDIIHELANEIVEIENEWRENHPHSY